MGNEEKRAKEKEIDNLNTFSNWIIQLKNDNS